MILFIANNLFPPKVENQVLFFPRENKIKELQLLNLVRDKLCHIFLFLVIKHELMVVGVG